LSIEYSKLPGSTCRVRRKVQCRGGKGERWRGLEGREEEEEEEEESGSTARGQDREIEK
jgi:hypothetical protein